MSSDYPNYGAVLAKKVQLSKDDGIVFHDATDDSKTVTLKLASGSMSAGNVDVTLPLSATTLGGGGDIPDGSSAGQQLFWSGSAWQAQAVSGDVTADQSGAFTVANDAIESAMINNGAVTSAKLAAGAVDSAALGSGAVGSSALAAGAVDSAALASGAVGSTALASGAVDSAALAAGAVGENALGAGSVTSAKLGADSVGVSALGVTAGAVTASKAMVVDANRDIDNVNEMGLVLLQWGTEWRAKTSGGSLVFEYSADGGSTWTQKQAFSNA